MRLLTRTHSANARMEFPIGQIKYPLFRTQDRQESLPDLLSYEAVWTDWPRGLKSRLVELDDHGEQSTDTYKSTRNNTSANIMHIDEDTRH